MAFGIEKYQNALWEEFVYYASGGADGLISESATAPNAKIWKLKEVRVHCSSAFASTEDLTVRISSALGTAYSGAIVSQAMATLVDFRTTFDEMGILLLSDDALTVALSLVSGVNTVGIQLIGWAVNG